MINTTNCTNHNKFQVKGLNSQNPDQKYHTKAQLAKLAVHVITNFKKRSKYMQSLYIPEPAHHIKVKTHSPLPQQSHTSRHTPENTENEDINQQLRPIQPFVTAIKKHR